MLKTNVKSLLIAMLIISPVFADETLSTFNQQIDADYPEPNSEASYFATRAPIESKIFTYLGLSVGARMTSLKTETTVNNAHGTAKKDAGSFGGGVYGGIGTNFDRFYIGSELSLAYNLLSKDIVNIINGFNTKLSVKQTMSAALDLVPGYMMQAKDILLYARLGLGVNAFNLKFTDVANVVDNSANKFNIGLRAGLGAEFLVSDSLSVRTEYVYSQYNNVSDTCSSKSGNQYAYKLKASGAHQINLGLTMRL